MSAWQEVLETNFNAIVWVWILLAFVLFPVQLRITAPYGRHARPGKGAQVANRLGWIVMESVSLVVFAWLFLAGDATKTAPAWIFFALWAAHYVNRSFIFPLRLRTKKKLMPVAIVLAAISFNIINASLNGYYLGFLGDPYPEDWLGTPQFIIGLFLFVAGAIINLWSDNRLISLRESHETGYQVPHGGLFGYVSCPNHLGEIVEWTGFAIMCWNLPALSFAIWTAANLIPRSLAHHRWYRQHFADYPGERKAVIPFIV